MPLPEFNDAGDLPPGIHGAALNDVIARFGATTAQRVRVGERLARIHSLVHATGHVARFIVFGSFVTSKAAPNDVDVFLLKDDQFEASQVTGEAATLFDHARAQVASGASIFWVRQFAALGGEEATVEYWQIKRDGSLRGIVEVIG